MTIVAVQEDTNMTELWSALLDPDLPFLRYALITGLLASVSFGIIGTFVLYDGSPILPEQFPIVF